jgi:hypothetical protein
MNYAEKECIPYEQALILKELGFNIPCNYLYNSSDDNPKPYPCDIIGLSQDWNTLYTKDANKHLLSAPLYQQAFRWFKDNYDLKKYYGVFPHHTIMFNYVLNGGDEEHAEFACLIELIEIIKNYNI